MAAILGFIGVKLLVEACHGQGWLRSVPEIEPLPSLGVIVVVLTVTVAASLAASRRRDKRVTARPEAGGDGQP